MSVANSGVNENFKVSDLNSDNMPAIRLENFNILSSGNGTSDISTQFINIPVLQDGSSTAVEPQQSYILATSSDGNTILVDASQLAMLSEQNIPLYDGSGLFQLASQSTSDSNLTLDNTPDIREEQVTTTDLSKIVEKNTPDDDDEILPPEWKRRSQKCDICNLILPGKKALFRHKKLHADEKPHCCDECDASFNNANNLILHKALHSTMTLKCPECDRQFSRLASFKSHLKLHETEENLVCSECGDEFVTKYKLDRHMEDHLKEKTVDKSFICKYCSKGFEKLTYLKDHMKIHNKLKLSLNRKQYKKIKDRSKFPHKCHFCGKQFQKPSQLVRHLRIHTGERPYKCDICNRAFNQKGALEIHKVKHTGARPFMCEFCPATFAQRGNVRNHIHRVHSLLPLDTSDGVHKCELCSCVFKKLGSLNAHMSRSHSSSSVTFIEVTKESDEKGVSEVTDVVQQLIEMSKEAKTHDLNKESFEKVALESNISSDILQQALENSGLVSTEESERSKSCVMTVEDTATGTLRKHIMRNVGGVRWYQCMYCTKEFKKSSDLVRHIRIHTHERPFKCDQCFRSFAVKSTLNVHVKTHTGAKEFSCEHCKKLFSTSGSLKVHLLLHTGVKPFSCHLCEKTFRTSGHRKSHMHSHERERTSKRSKKTVKVSNMNDINVADIPLQEPILITDEGFVQPVPKNSPMYNEMIKAKFTGDRPYPCTMCEKAFKKSSHLKQHIRSHTGERPYACQICKRSFVSNGVLKAHVRIHSGMKAYQCKLCEAAFTTNGSLKRHMYIHSNERPYMCPYCQKTFKTAMNCKKHMQIHRYELALGLASGVSMTVMSDGVAGIQNPEETAKEIFSLSTEQPEGTTDVINTDVENVQTVEENGCEGESALSSNTDTYITTEEVAKISEIIPQHLTQEVYNTETGMIEHIEVVTQPEVFTQTSNIFSIAETGFDGHQLTLQADTESEFITSDAANENLAHANLSNILEQQQETVETTQTTIAENSMGIKPKVAKKQKFKRPFKCEQCPKTFRKSSHLKQHIVAHTGEKNFWCSICGDMFAHSRILKQHIKTRHENIKEFKCAICDSSFTSNYNLTRHMDTHETGYSFHCAYCSEKFVTKEYYKMHLNEYHQISETREVIVNELVSDAPTEVFEGVEVQISDSAVSEKIPLRSKTSGTDVIAQEGGSDYNPKQTHSCPECPKSFKKPSDLVRHFRIHTGEKPYTCDSCGKSFTVKSTLISHEKTHTGEKNFSCHICESLFATKGSLKIHMRLHTGAKPFKCPHCELHFRTSGHRKSHMASHFKDRASRKKKSLSSSNYNKESIQIASNIGSTVVSLGEDVNVFQTEACTELPTFTSDSFQLPANLFSPNVQLTTIDPNTLLPKPFQIDASMLQQLQTLNFNITINPTLNETQIVNSKPTVDANQTQQIISIDGNVPTVSNAGGTFTINPNMIIQGLGFTIASQQQPDVQNPDNLTLIIPGTSLLKTNTNNVLQNGDLLETQVLTVEENPKENCEFIDSSRGQEIFLNAPNVSSYSEIISTPSTQSETVHVCNVCSKEFQTMRQLQGHLKVHKKPESIYRCEICKINFKLKAQLVKHLNSTHKEKS